MLKTNEDVAVEVVALRREFRDRRARGASAKGAVALDGVDLDIRHGEVLGLLGPNGAGKTTLVKILSTVLLPTSGTARVMGLDITRDTAAVRRIVGIVFGGERGLYGTLSPRQSLRYWAALYGVPRVEGNARVERLLERVGLRGRADDRVETFSRGMKQRLHLARGLVGDPRVLFLDEPTTGMDPVAARDFRALVGELRADGLTILVTTHDMAEADAICDRIALIDSGVVQAIETPAVLKARVSHFLLVHVDGIDDVTRARLATIDGVSDVRLTGHGDERTEVECDGQVAVAAVLALLLDGGNVTGRLAAPTLDEVYVHAFGRRGMRV